MLLRSLLERLAPRGGSWPLTRAKRRPRSYGLTVETLEDRCMPAAWIGIGDASITEGNDGTLNAAIPVTVSPWHGNNVTVNYNTVNGSAVAGSDFNAVSGTLKFTKNELTKSILIPIRGDRELESTESFSVRLSNAKGAQIARSEGFVAIRDNEPRVSMNGSTLEGDSGAATLTCNVSLPFGYDAPWTVNYATAGGTATPGDDYTAASGTLIFQPGQTLQTIAIAVNGDRLPEPDETILVNLTTPGSEVTSAGIVTIRDNEPRISMNKPTLLEGDSGTATLQFDVSLQGAYDLPVTVNYATAGGTATPGDDYTAASGTLTFQPGQTLQTIVIAVNGDRLPEPDETILVNLATPESYVTIANSVGSGTIANNEPHIRIADYAEQGAWASSIIFYVTLAIPYDQVVTVDFATWDGSAVAGVDYVDTSGTLTFNPGETTQYISVQLLSTEPADKSFYVSLFNPSPNALLVNNLAVGFWYNDSWW